MKNALLRLLPEFELPPSLRTAAPGFRPRERAKEPEAFADVDALPDLDLLPVAEEPETEAEPAQGVAEAVAAALAEAETRHAAALAAAGARAASDLEAARARWVAEQGAALAESFARAASATTDAIAEAAAALLEPFVAEAIRRAAIAELREAVADLVVGGGSGRIAVYGPQDLLDGLAAAVARASVPADRVDLVPSDAPEVTITADGSTVRTRLGAWMQALRGRVEGES